jgi:hypothetical protein
MRSCPGMETTVEQEIDTRRDERTSKKTGCLIVCMVIMSSVALAL